MFEHPIYVTLKYCVVNSLISGNIAPSLKTWCFKSFFKKRMSFKVKL